MESMACQTCGTLTRITVRSLDNTFWCTGCQRWRPCPPRTTEYNPICAICQREIDTANGKDHTAECLITPEGIVKSDEAAKAWRAGVAAAHQVIRLQHAISKGSTS